MTLIPLCQEGKIFDNHSHIYITYNTEPKLKPDKKLLSRKLLVKTDNKFVTKKYDLLFDIKNSILLLKLQIVILLIVLAVKVIN